MYCIETIDCIMFKKSNTIIQNDILENVRQPNDKLFYQVKCPLQATLVDADRITPAPLLNKEQENHIILHNFIQMIISAPHKQPTLEYTNSVEQSIKNIEKYLDSLNLKKIRTHYLQATTLAIGSLTMFLSALKKDNTPSNINLQFMNHQESSFIYAVFKDIAVIYFANTPEAVNYISNNHNVKVIYCGTYTDYIQSVEPTHTAVVPQNTQTTKIPLATIYKKETKKGFLKTVSIYDKIEPLSIPEFYALKGKYQPVSTYFPKSMDIIPSYFLTPRRLVVKIKDQEQTLIADLNENQALYYEYNTQPKNNFISKFKHSTHTPITTETRKYCSILYSDNYKIQLDGKDGKNNRKLKNRFEKLIQENKLSISLIRDPNQIKESIPEIYNLLTEWSKIKTKEGLFISNGVSTLIPYHTTQTILDMSILCILVRDETQKLIGFSLTYQANQDLVNLAQGVTLNSKDEFSGLQKYLHFIEIDEWRKTGVKDIFRGNATIGDRIYDYNVRQLKADKIFVFKYHRSV